MEILTYWEAKGVKQGRKEGLQEGRQEGKAELVVRLLRKRIDCVPLHVIERVNKLPIAKLDVLTEAQFDIAAITDLDDWFSKSFPD